jgi:hypothetical protein
MTPGSACRRTLAFGLRSRFRVVYSDLPTGQNPPVLRHSEQ